MQFLLPFIARTMSIQIIGGAGFVGSTFSKNLEPIKFEILDLKIVSL